MSIQVLGVDGSSQVRSEILSTLKEIGINSAKVAADADKAINLLKKGQFDVVLTDWNISTKDGQQFVREIPKFNKAARIIAMTSEADKEQALKANQAGAFNLLVKPFSADSLREKLDMQMSAVSS